MSLLIARCAPGQILGPALTPTPTSTLSPTPTLTPTVTPSETPIPGAIITGRVYLMDRDEPVRTTIRLARHEDLSEEVGSTTTDELGYDTFLVEEPDTYVIQVSVMDLLDICDNLRTESGGWFATQLYDTSGIADVNATSPPMSITIGAEISLDCELYCD